MTEPDRYGNCPSLIRYGRHQFTKGTCRTCGFVETRPGIVADESYWASLIRSDVDRRLANAQLDALQPKVWRDPTLARLGNTPPTDMIPRPNEYPEPSADAIPVPEEHYLPRVKGESCPSIILSYKHQWKRRLENKHYVYRCRWCDAPKFQDNKYLTAQGLLEEHFAKPKPPRERMRSQMYDRYAPYEPYLYTNDPKLISDFQDREILETSDDKQGRYRRVAMAFTADDHVANRISLRNRILSSMEQHPNTKGQDLEPVRKTLEDLDRIVIWQGAEHHKLNRPQPDKFLTEQQLENLAAAAAYHYLGLTWEQIAGKPDSIFPNITRQTAKNWYAYVLAYDGRLRRVPLMPKFEAPLARPNEGKDS